MNLKWMLLEEGQTMQEGDLLFNMVCNEWTKIPKNWVGRDYVEAWDLPKHGEFLVPVKRDISKFTDAALVNTLNKLEVCRDWIEGTPKETSSNINLAKGLEFAAVSKDVILSQTKPHRSIRVKL